MTRLVARVVDAVGSTGRRVDAERGSMTVEVAFLLVLLVVPLFYLIGTLSRVQAGAYAASAAAREAGRGFVTADGADEAVGRAHASAHLVLASHGFGPEDATIELGCAQEPCLSAGGRVSVSTTVTVPLPLVPDFMTGAVPSGITLSAHHVEAVDEYREGP